MSVSEILAELPKLTPLERDEIAGRLSALRRLDSPEFLDEMDRRIERMEAGHFTTDTQLAEILRARGIRR